MTNRELEPCSARSGRSLRCLLIALASLASSVAIASPTGQSQDDALARDERSRTKLEQGVLEELNALREAPAAYAAHLESMRKLYDGPLLRRPGKKPIFTSEGASALLEAIDVLAAATPMGPLAPSRALERAASDHVSDQGTTGALGHRGSDGSNSLVRMQRHGESQGASGEVIVYGWSTAREVVADLLIDDGIANRGHRKAILDPAFRLAGVSCGDHRVYGVMCVVDMAEAFHEASEDEGRELVADGHGGSFADDGLKLVDAAR